MLRVRTSWMNAGRSDIGLDLPDGPEPVGVLHNLQRARPAVEHHRRVENDAEDEDEGREPYHELDGHRTGFFEKMSACAPLHAAGMRRQG